MFKRIIAFILCCLFIIPAAACQKTAGEKEKGAAANTEAAEVKPTEAAKEEPTEAPTEAPTQAPTAEPTDTPTPEGWIVDPYGIIPNTVEILVPYFQTDFPLSFVWCIARVDGKTMLQEWNGVKGVVYEIEVPEIMAKGKYIGYQPWLDEYLEGDIAAKSYLTELGVGVGPWDLEPFVFFYYDGNVHSICFECTSACSDSRDGSVIDGIMLATLDGKLIRYFYGDDFYLMHDFGEGTEVYVDWGNIGVGDVCVPLEKIEFTKVYL